MDAGHNRAPRRTTDVRVDPAHCPGWVTGLERPPAAGERVYTHEGTGILMRVLGRTGAAGRLLEVSMDDGRKPLFFTADANIMVEPKGRQATPRTAVPGKA